MWSRSRDELFYQALDGQIMAVSFRVVGDAFEPGNVRQLPRPFVPLSRLRSVNVHPDGNRFAVSPRPETAILNASTIVLRPNFADELRRLAPEAR
jgi:hypothetical protein